MAKLPTYEFLINDDEKSGVKCISIVSSPAMQTDFLVFDNQEKQPKYIFLTKDEKEYKGIVAGLSMIPNKLIYRVDESGQEYNGYFSETTIEKIRNKYHKEVLNLQNVNLEHSDYSINAYLVESYILDSEDRVNEVLKKGIKEACLGAWYTAFKVEDKEVFDACLAGDFKGFSVEAMLDLELKLSKNNSNNKIVKKMKKNLAEKIKEGFNKILNTILFEEMLVPELNIKLTWGEVGESVTKTYTNTDGVEVTEPTGKGEFTVEDGRIVSVDENSALVEVRDAAPEVEVPKEVVIVPAVTGDTTTISGSTDTVVVSDFDKPLGSFLDLSKDGKYSIECVIEAGAVKSATVKSIAQLMSEIQLAQSDLDKKLRQLIPNDKAGSYSISVDVNDKGEYTYGVVSSYTSLKLSSEEKITALNNEIAALKTKLSESIAEPILTDTNTVNTGTVKELTVYEAICQRSGVRPL